ncbi:hypothetical protein HHK36_015319 [Tetracentron sinense]|uniref:AP2/ERF domain-containing protein n=1 Tax=Tetracentron sinense TaxID=13715 RepID=A0A835DGN5_TETSI|nr:hypothetical protein HHK36_015319 [Tetracentron sinense]
MESMSQEEFVMSLRRKSISFTRGSSIYRGVTSRNRDGHWQARIKVASSKRDFYLGTFSSEEEAAKAYDTAAIELKGMNALTNFDISNYLQGGSKDSEGFSQPKRIRRSGKYAALRTVVPESDCRLMENIPGPDRQPDKKSPNCEVSMGSQASLVAKCVNKPKMRSVGSKSSFEKNHDLENFQLELLSISRMSPQLDSFKGHVNNIIEKNPEEDTAPAGFATKTSIHRFNQRISKYHGVTRKSISIYRGSSIHMGVTRHHDGRWQARISGEFLERRASTTEQFSTEEEAAKAYDNCCC